MDGMFSPVGLVDRKQVTQHPNCPNLLNAKIVELTKVADQLTTHSSTAFHGFLESIVKLLHEYRDDLAAVRKIAGTALEIALTFIMVRAENDNTMAINLLTLLSDKNSYHSDASKQIPELVVAGVCLAFLRGRKYVSLDEIIVLNELASQPQHPALTLLTVIMYFDGQLIKANPEKAKALLNGIEPNMISESLLPCLKTLQQYQSFLDGSIWSNSGLLRGVYDSINWIESPNLKGDKKSAKNGDALAARRVAVDSAYNRDLKQMNKYGAMVVEAEGIQGYVWVHCLQFKAMLHLAIESTEIARDCGKLFFNELKPFSDPMDFFALFGRLNYAYEHKHYIAASLLVCLCTLQPNIEDAQKYREKADKHDIEGASLEERSSIDPRFSIKEIAWPTTDENRPVLGPIQQTGNLYRPCI